MKQLFLSLTGLLCIFHAASAAHAQLYEWVRTIENPTGSASEFFGDSGTVGFVGDNIVIGAWAYSDGGNIESGIAYLFDQEGNLLTTFENPTPETGDWFGKSVLGIGDNILVGAPRDSTGAADSGSAYLFNQQGDLLRTINNPTPGEKDWFGGSLAAVDDGFVAGGTLGDSPQQKSGLVYRFDSTGELVSELHKPSSVAGHFLIGRITSASLENSEGAENILAVTTSDSIGLKVAVVDLDNNLLYEVERPDGIDLVTFGIATTFTDNQYLLVGNPMEDPIGAVHLFDVHGKLLNSFHHPGPVQSPGDFGFSVAALSASEFAVAAPFSPFRKIEAGAVFLFGTDGTMFQTLTTPYHPDSFEFGRSVTSQNGLLFIGEDSAFTASHSYVSAVHIFAPVPEPTTWALAGLGIAFIALSMVASETKRSHYARWRREL